DHVRRVVHFHARLDRPGRLLFQVGGAAVPELRDVEYRVEGGRRVARALLPAVADGSRHVVCAAGTDGVAAIAADEVAARQARLEIEHAAQLDLRFGQLPAADFRHFRGDRLEQLVGDGSQILCRGLRLHRRGDHRGDTERQSEQLAHGYSLSAKWLLLLNYTPGKQA